MAALQLGVRAECYRCDLEDEREVADTADRGVPSGAAFNFCCEAAVKKFFRKIMQNKSVLARKQQ